MTVDEWIAQLRPALKPGTVRAWGYYLDRMSEAFAGRGLDDVSKRDLAALADRVAEGAMERATGRSGQGAKESFITAARYVWREAVIEHRASGNPAALLEKPARADSERRSLSGPEVAEIFRIMQSARDPHLNVMILRLALETGARRGEMLSLTWESRRPAAGCLALRGKNDGGRAHLQPITADLWDGLMALASARLGPRPKAKDPLLVGRNGRPITRRWFEHQAERIRDAVPSLGPGGDVWFTWHLCRYTAATNVRRIADPKVASRFLRHKQTLRKGDSDSYDAADLAEVRGAVSAVWGAPMAGDAHPYTRAKFAEAQELLRESLEEQRQELLEHGHAFVFGDNPF